VLNVWVAPSDNPSDARVITNDTYRGISQYFWAPNSAFVYYIQDQGGDENFHVYSANIETGDVVDLTPVKDGARATVESISSQRPDEIVVGINERNAQLFDLYLVDVMTGERELLKENPGFAGWLIDNNLDPRFGFQPTPDGGGNIVDFEGEVFAVIPPEDFLSTSAVGFNAANDAVLILDSRGRDTAALTQVALGSGEVEVLAENDEADISGIFIDRRTLEPIAYNVNHLKSQWYPVDDTTAADLEGLTAALGGSLSILAATDDMSKWIVHEDAPERSGTYFIYDREETKMLEQYPSLADYTLAPMQALTIKSRDGLDLPSYLTLPVGSDGNGDGKPDSAIPMVLAVHGGPWAVASVVGQPRVCRLVGELPRFHRLRQDVYAGCNRRICRQDA
jgi:dipeptidyl aminopeptidase/acylaminoacyl peptidase